MTTPKIILILKHAQLPTNYLLISFNFIFFTTGPGGVGNSSSNLVWLSSDQVSGITDGNKFIFLNDISGNGNKLYPTKFKLYSYLQNQYCKW